jgi:hypothetical protein
MHVGAWLRSSREEVVRSAPRFKIAVDITQKLCSSVKLASSATATKTLSSVKLRSAPYPTHKGKSV